MKDITNKLLVAILLSLVSNAAMADWTPITESAIAFYYADYSTKKVDRHKIKIWSMYDFKTPQTGGNNIKYSSVAFQEVYDCKEVQSMSTTAAFYSGQMGQGNVVFTRGAEGWSPIFPNSVADRFLKTLCSKKH